MKIFRSTCVAFLICFLVTATSSKSVGAISEESSPATNDGAKWRIGYLEGGPFTNYQGSLKATVQALMKLGWIEPAALPPLGNSEETRELWNWLSTSANSRYLEFVEDAYWSAGWNADKRRQKAREAVRRLNFRQDIDLMLAMGTWAGQDLVHAVKKVPIVVMSCTDPVKSGIIESREDSGQDNVFAWIDPDRFVRRHRLLHDILNFKKLGIVYENTETGRAYAGLDSVMQVARERGFEVVECHAAEVGLTAEQSRAQVAACIQKLAPWIDAFTVTDINGENHMFFPQLIKPFFDHGVLVYSPVRGPVYVRRGALIGIMRMNYTAMGNFYAQAIARILNGVRPRDLDQEYREPLGLVVNLEAARRLHYKVPTNLLAVADEVYQKIESDPVE